MSEPITPTVYLSLAGYARHVGKSERTVLRWLNDPAWELPGARMVDGTWSIPAEAQPRRRPAAEIVPIRQPEQAPAVLEAAPTLVDQLDDLPAYLTIEQAAAQLGIPASQIRRHPADFDTKPYGPHGKLVIPQRVIRQIRGGA